MADIFDELLQGYQDAGEKAEQLRELLRMVVDQEKLIETHQSAQKLLSDLRAIYSQTDNLFLRELVVPWLGQVEQISGALCRVSTPQRVCEHFPDSRK